MKNRYFELSTVFVFLAVALANYLIFIYVPNERVMGPVQRIFYFHVAAAVAAYISVAVLLIASLSYLATRKPVMDGVSVAASEVGFVFCSIVMVSGMIWGHAAWNTFFRWEPRLVSFLFLWLIFLGLTCMRRFGDPSRAPEHSAVLGVIAALTVPVVVYSIQLLPQTAQLHPVVVENRGLKEPSFQSTLFYTMAAVATLTGLLIWLRTRIAVLESKRSKRQPTGG